MPLFTVPKRSGKDTDAKIAKKIVENKPRTATPVRGGLLGRINEIKATVERSLGAYRDKYVLIQDEDVLKRYIDACIANGYVAIDTETDGLDPLVNRIAGVCLFTVGQKGAYVPINHISYVTNALVPSQLSAGFVMPELQRLIDSRPQIDMFNAKFDIRVLRAQGLSDIYCTWDGYLAARLLNENEPEKGNGLKKLHQKYVLDGKADAFSYEELFKGIPFTQIPLSCAYLYAARDPEITYELCEYQRKYLREDSERQDMRDLYWVFKNIEMPCVPVVADMEDVGVGFDTVYAQKLSEIYNQRLGACVDRFYSILAQYSAKIDAYRKRNPNCKLDDPINLASTTQIAILLYDVLQVGVVDDRNPRGTGESILSKLNLPLADALLEYKGIQKLVSTYIDKLPGCINPNDGRIHCSFNQYGADTGRFSSSDPNLQNIPSHNKDIRKMFVASDGYVLMSSDYSQQEPKVMAQLCQDERMLQAYREGKDLYAEIAALSFNTTYENCLEFRSDGTTNPEGKARRSQAKSILLGVLYGRGVPSIAEQLGTTTDKAQKIKDSVFKGFPAIPKFEQDSLTMAEELGYVTTLWGRKRRLPDLQLPEFEFKWKDGNSATVIDVIDFDDDGVDDGTDYLEVPEERRSFYLRKLQQARYGQKRTIFEQANKEGIWIVDNGAKIADAQRQCVNARIQGSAADMTKLAMILCGTDERLKQLGFRLLIQVHDELIAECPEQNMIECKQRFAELMSQAAQSRLTIPIKCDVEVTRAWYGEKVERCYEKH